MQAWDRFVEKTEQHFGKATIDRWIRPLRILKFDACNLYLEARDSFQAAWFEEHFRPLVKEQFRNNNHNEIKVHLSVVGAKSKEGEKESSSVSQFAEALKFNPDSTHTQCCYEQYHPSFNSTIPYQVICKLTGFDPLKQIFEPSQQTLPEYNPIFLHGPQGSGKTHLLMAATIALQVQGKKAFYVTGETFSAHVVAAIRAGKMQEFRSSYRHVDALIIDDVQALGRKNATQEELHHTFNALHTDGKQIILASDLAPCLLENIAERLISRFEWGITFPLEVATETQTLKAIAKSRAQFFNVNLSEDLFDYLSTHFETPATLCHAIEAVALKVQFHPELQNIPLPLKLVGSVLDQLLADQKEKEVEPTDILQIVAETFGIKTEDITSKSQARESVLPRQLTMFLLRSILKMPYIKIGQFLGRDHSTVMSSIKNITKGIEAKNDELLYHLTDIRRKLHSLVPI
ncbi:MAG: Chromosomal replication initiator protein DnaA [Chlamydiia bacterium]|nr:Chromosomal replication initiator protein DnaA [Chlamydiia bacterium]